MKGCTCFHHRLLECMEQGLNSEAQLLLEKVRNPREVADASGKTLLHYAVQYSNTPMVQHLIEKGCEVNGQDNSEINPLMTAVNSNNRVTVELLLKHEADIYVTDSNGVSALQLAFQCRMNDAIILFKSDRQSILDMLFDEVNKDFLTDKPAITKLFLNADIMEKFTVITCANVGLAKIILKTGFPIDYREPQMYRTALHCAIILAKFENAKLLINKGAYIAVLDRNRYSPLRYYTCNFQYVDQKFEILKSLLRYFNHLNGAEDKAMPNHVECLFWEGTRETVMALLQSGIDAVIRRGNSCHPLDLLTANRKIDFIDIVESAANAGITFDFNAICFYDNKSLLMMATQFLSDRRNVRLAEYLIKHGADVNFTNSDGTSVLHTAATNCFSDSGEKVIELMLQHGANPQIVHGNGKTLIDDLFSLECRLEVRSMKPIVAHLAMLDAVDVSSVSEVIRNSIYAYAVSKDYFDLCSRQLGELKNIVLDQSATLFKLLHINEETLVADARNHELITSFKTTMEKMSHLESYYINTLQTRVTKAVKLISLEEKVAPIVFNILISLFYLYYNLKNIKI